MKLVVDNMNELFGPWISERLERPWIVGTGHTIGLIDTERGPIAGAFYEACNGASVLVHLVIEGKINREFVWFGSYYPFIQLGVYKLIAPVESTNKRSVRFTEHYGFTLEATLKGAARDGDLLLYTMTRKQCPWLEVFNGQT